MKLKKKRFLFFTIKFSIFKNIEDSSILFQLNFNFYPDSILANITITYASLLQAVKRTESIMPRHPYEFAQFLQLLPRYEFQSIINKYKGDYRIKHFKCRDKLACMIFVHVRQEKSLRDIDMALNAHAGKLYHIGIKQCQKSTLVMLMKVVITAYTRNLLRP